jgi:hypothetical protein
MKSSLFNLNTKDFVKGLFVAVFTSVITIVYTSVQAGAFEFDGKTIATTALTSALAYIMKNFVTNSEDQLLKKDTETTAPITTDEQV